MVNRNWDIKHAVEWKDGGLKYICIGAVGNAHPEKIAIKPKDLNCRNCLQRLGYKYRCSCHRNYLFKTFEDAQLHFEVMTHQYGGIEHIR